MSQARDASVFDYCCCYYYRIFGGLAVAEAEAVGFEDDSYSSFEDGSSGEKGGWQGEQGGKAGKQRVYKLGQVCVQVVIEREKTCESQVDVADKVRW